MKSSTFLFRAKGRSAATERRYERCPLCGCPEIRLGVEVMRVSGPHGKTVEVRLRRWACPDCQERFPTSDSRRRLDDALGLNPATRRAGQRG